MSFDRLAPVYRAMEAMLAGGLMQRCRTAHLTAVGGAPRVLVYGEGPGRFVEALLARHPQAAVVVVEASARMIWEARRRLPSPAAIDWIHADARAWAPEPEAFDVIASHFFLDCFPPEDLRLLVPAAARGLRPGGLWLLSDFQRAAHGWRRWRSRAILWLMYRWFRVVTRLPASRLECPDQFLERQGLNLESRRLFSAGLLRADLWRRPPPPGV